MGLTFDERLKNLTETLGTEYDIQRTQELIKAHRWVFAKTYAAFCPHEYTLRDGWSKKDWERLVKQIWLYGMDACFGKQSAKRYWFDHAGGYYYFLFPEDTDEDGMPTEACCLINRARIPFFDFWVEEDLIGKIVRCKVHPGAPQMAQDELAKKEAERNSG